MTAKNQTPKNGNGHGRLGRLAAYAYRRRGRVVIAWILALFVAVTVLPALAGDNDADFGSDGSESDRAATLVQEHFPGRSGDTVNVVWRADAGVANPQTEARVDRFLAEAQRLEGIGEAGPPRVSRDGQIATTTPELE